MEITEIAKEAGLNLRTFLTPAAWKILNGDGQIQGRDPQKRLSMMLEVLQIALSQRKGPQKKVIYFSTRLGGRRDARLLLRATVENHSCGQPGITVMLPGEEGREKISEDEDGRVEKSIGDFYGQREKMSSKRQILIVDDEFAVRESLRMVLKPHYYVYTAADGEEALNILRARKIYLITLDLNMPKLSGIETLREIRKIDREVPVGIITGCGTEEDKREALFDGVKAFIPKPFDATKIVSVIDAIFEEQIEPNTSGRSVA